MHTHCWHLQTCLFPDGFFPSFYFYFYVLGLKKQSHFNYPIHFTGRQLHNDFCHLHICYPQTNIKVGSTMTSLFLCWHVKVCYQKSVAQHKVVFSYNSCKDTHVLIASKQLCSGSNKGPEPRLHKTEPVVQKSCLRGMLIIIILRVSTSHHLCCQYFGPTVMFEGTVASLSALL